MFLSQRGRKHAEVRIITTRSQFILLSQLRIVNLYALYNLAFTMLQDAIHIESLKNLAAHEIENFSHAVMIVKTTMLVKVEAKVLRIVK